jgi:hypothetical protein
MKRNILSYQEMYIATTLKFHLTWSEWLSLIKQITTNADKSVGEKEHLFPDGENVN